MKTDMKEVRRLSKALFDVVSLDDAINIIDSDLRGIVISHPYTNSAFIVSPKTKELINLMENKAAFDDFRQVIFDLIDKESNNLMSIMVLINKPYRLFWFKLIKSYLSKSDYAHMLKEVWVTSENPNMDRNVSLNDSLSFFKRADKNEIMDKEEKAFYDSLDDNVTLYRGVSKGREPFGLSYTTSKEKAIWFQERFSVSGSFLIALKVKKEDCICYINERDEREIILDTKKYKNMILSQIPRGFKYERNV